MYELNTSSRHKKNNKLRWLAININSNSYPLGVLTAMVIKQKKQGQDCFALPGDSYTESFSRYLFCSSKVSFNGNLGMWLLKDLHFKEKTNSCQ